MLWLQPTDNGENLRGNSILQKELTGYIYLALPEVFSVSYQETSVLVIFLTDAKFLMIIIPP